MSAKRKNQSAKEPPSKKKAKESKDTKDSWDQGGLLLADLNLIISPSQYKATKSKTRDKAFSKRAREAAKTFNEVKEKKRWSRLDLNFFARTLSTYFSAAELKSQAEIHEPTGQTRNKRDAIFTLVRSPIKILGPRWVGDDPFICNSSEYDKILLEREKEKKEKKGQEEIESELDEEDDPNEDHEARELQELEDDLSELAEQEESMKALIAQKREAMRKKEKRDNTSSLDGLDGGECEIEQSLVENAPIPKAKGDKIRAQTILNSGKMDEFTDFCFLDQKLQIDILNFRYFDLKKVIVDPTEPEEAEKNKKVRGWDNFASSQSTGSETRLNWHGFTSALAKVSKWVSVFAPGKERMILNLIDRVNEYYLAGYRLEDIIRYCNMIRFRACGPKADWTDPKIELEAFRRCLINPEQTPRSCTYEKKKYQNPRFKSNYNNNHSYRGFGRGFGRGRGYLYGRGRGMTNFSSSIRGRNGGVGRGNGFSPLCYWAERGERCFDFERGLCTKRHSPVSTRPAQRGRGSNRNPM